MQVERLGPVSITSPRGYANVLYPRLHDEAGSTSWLYERTTSARRALRTLVERTTSARRALVEPARIEPARRASFIV